MSQTNRMASLLAVVLLAASAIFDGADAKEHVVGDVGGWTTPQGRLNHFNNWAGDYKFNVGDTLVFNYIQDEDVAQVTKEAYEACDGSKPLKIVKTGPAKITLESAGEHYYICTLPNHCQGGQRLAIKVGNGDGSIALAPGSALAPGPSASASSSLHATHFPITFSFFWFFTCMTDATAMIAQVV